MNNFSFSYFILCLIIFNTLQSQDLNQYFTNYHTHLFGSTKFEERIRPTYHFRKDSLVFGQFYPALPYCTSLYKETFSFIKGSTTEKYVFDTVVIFRTMDTIREMYSYNSRGIELTKVIERFRNGSWENSTRSTKIFDSEDHIESLYSESWINGQWVMITRTTYWHDPKGKILTELYESRSNDIMENSFRDKYTYDERGNLVSRLIESWYINSWELFQKYTYTHDASGHQTSNLCEQWQSSTNQWINYFRYTYAYDSNGYNTSSTAENWSNGQWINFERALYTNDPMGHMLSRIDEQWSQGQWIAQYRRNYTYDTNWHELVAFSERWENGQWTNYFRRTAIYNLYGLCENSIFESWKGNIWIFADDMLFYSDDVGNIGLNFGCQFIFKYKTITISSIANNTSISTSYTLLQNYPNPFNPATTISFSLPSKSFVLLKVFDCLGREVAILANEMLPAGKYSRQLNAAHMSAGVYYYCLEAASFRQTKKLILLK